MSRKLLREPLLHFLLLGCSLFALHGWIADGSDPESSRIVVTAGQIDHLATTFARTWMRPPTEGELAGLIDEHVREEVLYREALAMGLDRDDLVVRRRLRQKLEFLFEDAAATVQPSDEELRAYLEKNSAAFRLETRVSFEHVFLDRERRGEAVDAVAAELLARLASDGAGADASALGDPFLLAHEFESSPRGEVAKLFGEPFAERLLELEPGTWMGPVESEYGLHLVRVRERTAGRLPELAEVRAAVEREWYAGRRAQASERFYQGLRQRYRVTVERPSTLGNGSVVATGGAP
jgi:hypothetical protein